MIATFRRCICRSHLQRVLQLADLLQLTMRRDFDSGRAMKTSRALAEKTSLVGVPLTKLVSSAASTSLPLPDGPVIK